MALQTHSFSYNGFTGNVEYDETTLIFYYSLPDDNIRYFERISFLEEDKLQEYECKFVTYLKNKLDEEIKGTREIVRYRVAKEEVSFYQQFEMATTPAGVKYMDFYKRSSINGLIEALEDFGCSNVNTDELICTNKYGRDGVIAFEPFAFQPVQPVYFTEVVGHETTEEANDGTIDVTVVDGDGGPYTYILDDGAEIPLAQITGLSSGNHTLVVKGSDGGKSIEKTITINAGA